MMLALIFIPMVLGTRALGLTRRASVLVDCARTEHFRVVRHMTKVRLTVDDSCCSEQDTQCCPLVNGVNTGCCPDDTFCCHPPSLQAGASLCCPFAGSGCCPRECCPPEPGYACDNATGLCIKIM